MTRHKILFVCTGNICRSPTAEGVARGLAAQLGVDHPKNGSYPIPSA
jgi:protein-tyrosine phosphatase